jgi:hypothetical protein
MILIRASVAGVGELETSRECGCTYIFICACRKLFVVTSGQCAILYDVKILCLFPIPSVCL